MIKILSYLNVSHHHHHHHHHHLIKLIRRLLLQRLSSAVHRSASHMLRVNNVTKKCVFCFSWELAHDKVTSMSGGRAFIAGAWHGDREGFVSRSQPGSTDREVATGA